MRRSLRFRRLPRALAGVRVRLTLWYLAIIALLFLIFSGVVAGTLRQAASTQMDNTLTTAATQLIATYNSSACTITLDDPWHTAAPGAKSPVRIAKGAGLGLFGAAILFDATGQPCTSATDGTPQVYGPLSAVGVADLGHFVFGKLRDLTPPAIISAMPLETRTPDGNLTSLDYSVYVTRLATGASSPVLVVAVPFDPNESLRTLIPSLLIAGPLTLLIAAVGGYWLATRAMRPVRLITRTAREIGERDLSRRLNLKSRDELGELARTFDGMLDRLQSAFARQRQFTADASHELRTPLTIVDLEVTRALGQHATPEEYERVLSVVQAENAHMARLVTDLLTLARADSGQATLRMEPLDLSDVALEVVERLAPLARQAGVHLVAGALPELPIQGDRSSLAQAAANLIENAIKYTAGAGTRVEVATGRCTQGKREWAWVRVTDDGPGIAAEHLPHLCERFYRVDAARTRESAGAAQGGKAEGSGLGLAIAEWAARANQGELRIRSAVDAGSTFELWLPLALA